MSIYDILAHSAVALGTVMLPSDLAELFPDTWTIFGNTYTCNYQGFAFTCGTFASGAYVSSLCIYYVCSLTFGLTQQFIQRRIEWFLHLFPQGTAWTFSVYMLLNDMMNPSKEFPFCWPDTLPNGCENEKCIRGSSEVLSLGSQMVIVLNLLNVAFIILSLSIVCFTLCRAMYKSKMSASESSEKADEYNFRKETSKIVVKHSFLYIMALVVTQVPSILNQTARNPTPTTRSLTLIFSPLHGFFNLIIFVWGKIYGIRLRKPTATTIEALKHLLTDKDGADDHAYFSNIEFVDCISQHKENQNKSDGLEFSKRKENVLKIDDIENIDLSFDESKSNGKFSNFGISNSSDMHSDISFKGKQHYNF